MLRMLAFAREIHFILLNMTNHKDEALMKHCCFAVKKLL